MFEIIHEYTWDHFRDKEYPEWYGYLNRQGEVLLPLRVESGKAAFHVPRGYTSAGKPWRKLPHILLTLVSPPAP